MPRLKTVHRRKKRYGIGDMNKRIKIHVRDIQPPDMNSASFKEGYDAGNEVWASVNTLDFVGAGQKLFDDVQIDKQPTHLFVIRWYTGVTTENIISWNGDYYEIVKAHDPEERHEYWELYSRLKGSTSKEANK